MSNPLGMRNTKLTLRKERLAELAADELASMGGGAPQTPPCTGTSHPFPTRDLRCLIAGTTLCPV